MKKLLTILTLALVLCLLCGTALAVEHHHSGVDISYPETAGAPDTITIKLGGNVEIEGNIFTPVGVNKTVLPKEATWPTTITYTHDKDHCVDPNGIMFDVLYKDADGNLYTRAYTITKADGRDVWNHEIESATEVKNAKTCELEKKCDCCGKMIGTGKYAHTWQDVVIKEATCQDKGEVKHVCSVCGVEEKDASGNLVIYDGMGGHHTFVLNITAPKCDPATMEIIKGEAFVKCAYCDTYVQKAYIDQWVKVGDMIADYETTKDKAAAVETGIGEARYKAICGEEVSAHDWTGWHEIDNNCEGAGYKIRYCNRCGHDESAKYPEGDARNYAKLPKWEIVVLNDKGYTCQAVYGKDYLIQCAYCGGSAAGHKIEKLDTATPADANKMTYTAKQTVIGTLKDNTYLRYEYTITATDGDTANKPDAPAAVTLVHQVSHVYKQENAYLLLNGTKVYTTQNTCVDDGYKYYRCIHDTATQYASYTHYPLAVVNAPKTGHNFGAWQLKEAPETKPDGTQVPGRWVRVCTNNFCLDTTGAKHQQEELKQMTVPCAKEADHVWETVILEAATCTKDGKTGEQCTKCLKIKDGSEKAIPAAHTWGEAKELTAATCTEKGVAIKTCTVCGAIEKAEIPAKGHTPEEVAEVPATCKTEGKKAGKVCSVCGVELEGFETIPADEKAHVWGEAEPVKAPTCTEVGSEIRTCEVCGKIEKAEVKALGHDWDEGKITKEATKEAKGEKTFTCKRCGETKTEEVEYVITADPKYSVTALAYNGKTVTGKLVHDEDTLVATNINVRVTFFIEGNYYMATIGEVAADGTFAVDGVGPIEYISVVATGSSSVSPEDVKAMGSGEITVK